MAEGGHMTPASPFPPLPLLSPSKPPLPSRSPLRLRPRTAVDQPSIEQSAFGAKAKQLSKALQLAGTSREEGLPPPIPPPRSPLRVRRPQPVPLYRLPSPKPLAVSPVPEHQKTNDEELDLQVSAVLPSLPQSRRKRPRPIPLVYPPSSAHLAAVLSLLKAAEELSLQEALSEPSSQDPKLRRLSVLTLDAAASTAVLFPPASLTPSAVPSAVPSNLAPGTHLEKHARLVRNLFSLRSIVHLPSLRPEVRPSAFSLKVLAPVRDKDSNLRNELQSQPKAVNPAPGAVMPTPRVPTPPRPALIALYSSSVASTSTATVNQPANEIFVSWPQEAFNALPSSKKKRGQEIIDIVEDHILETLMLTGKLDAMKCKREIFRAPDSFLIFPARRFKDHSIVRREAPVDEVIEPVDPNVRRPRRWATIKAEAAPSKHIPLDQKQRLAKRPSQPLLYKKPSRTRVSRQVKPYSSMHSLRRTATNEPNVRPEAIREVSSTASIPPPMPVSRASMGEVGVESVQKARVSNTALAPPAHLRRRMRTKNHSAGEGSGSMANVTSGTSDQIRRAATNESAAEGSTRKMSTASKSPTQPRTPSKSPSSDGNAFSKGGYWAEHGYNSEPKPEALTLHASLTNLSSDSTLCSPITPPVPGPWHPFNDMTCVSSNLDAKEAFYEVKTHLTQAWARHLEKCREQSRSSTDLKRHPSERHTASTGQSQRPGLQKKPSRWRIFSNASDTPSLKQSASKASLREPHGAAASPSLSVKPRLSDSSVRNMDKLPLESFEVARFVLDEMTHSFPLEDGDTLEEYILSAPALHREYSKKLEEEERQLRLSHNIANHLDLEDRRTWLFTVRHAAAQDPYGTEYYRIETIIERQRHGLAMIARRRHEKYIAVNRAAWRIGWATKWVEWAKGCVEKEVARYERDLEVEKCLQALNDSDEEVELQPLSSPPFSPAVHQSLSYADIMQDISKSKGKEPARERRGSNSSTSSTATVIPATAHASSPTRSITMPHYRVSPYPGSRIPPLAPARHARNLSSPYPPMPTSPPPPPPPPPPTDPPDEPFPSQEELFGDILDRLTPADDSPPPPVPPKDEYPPNWPLGDEPLPTPQELEARRELKKRRRQAVFVGDLQYGGEERQGWREVDLEQVRQTGEGK